LITAVGTGQFKKLMYEEILDVLNLWITKLCTVTMNVSNECDGIFYLLLYILWFIITEGSFVI
jgi:hypothetical protein